MEASTSFTSPRVFLNITNFCLIGYLWVHPLKQHDIIYGHRPVTKHLELFITDLCQQRLFFLVSLLLCLGLQTSRVFTPPPFLLIWQPMPAPHVTKNKLPCFLGIVFHRSLCFEFTFRAMFSSVAQSSNNPLESCLSRTTAVCPPHAPLVHALYTACFYVHHGGK